MENQKVEKRPSFSATVLKSILTFASPQEGLWEEQMQIYRFCTTPCWPYSNGYFIYLYKNRKKYISCDDKKMLNKLPFSNCLWTTFHLIPNSYVGFIFCWMFLPRHRICTHPENLYLKYEKSKKDSSTWSMRRNINSIVCYACQIMLGLIILIMKQSEKSILIKSWILTSVLKRSNSRGMFNSYRMKLLLSLHAPSLAILMKMFSSSWTGRCGLTSLPAKSTALAELYFCFWKLVKDEMYLTSVSNFMQLKWKITTASRTFSQEFYHKHCGLSLENRLHDFIRD